MHGHLNLKKKKKRNCSSLTLCFLWTEDVGSLAKCGRILLAVLVCCLPHAVVVFIYLLGLLTACEQDHDGTVLNLLASCQQTCMTYTIAVCTVKKS